MKNVLIAFLFMTSAFVALGEKYTTTAKLTDNMMIWPPVEFSEVENGIPISGEFIESKSILVVEQGNWVEHTYLVKYEITKAHNKFPHQELSFIVIRRWPTAGSGIKMKALPFHFREGNMSFIVQKDDDVKHMNYFKIEAYQNK